MMARLGIYTQDLRFYYRAIEEINLWKIPYVSLDSSGDVSSDIIAVLSEEKDRTIFHTQLKGKNPRSLIRQALPYFINKNCFHEVIIGIDPGPKPGMAILADKILMETEEMPDIHSILDYVKCAINDYKSDSKLIRLGDGDAPNRERIKKLLSFIDIEINIVDEYGTSMPHQTHDNMISAARIADIERFNRFGRNKIYGTKRSSQIEKEFFTYRNIV